ncbi:reverse transcriptase family protein [Legionella longbeachae]|uniref:reverse transcriptase family protein n=1 Tax=Legionella longbeachae TaxID=450 RepID=UPI001404CB99|nr:reverse transcriptase family protein [Legionella longbeachae]QIN32734.1 hypothetical protein GCB94_11575 [Legionella longbeachae]
MVKQIDRYPLERSPLYNAKSLKKISCLLSLSSLKVNKNDRSKPMLQKLYKLTPTDLDNFAAQQNYTIKELIDKKGKSRSTEIPAIDLKWLHYRLEHLLKKIEPPPYLFSAIKGRSCKDNARMHATNTQLFKIDIKTFYPNINFGKVYNFYRHILHCEHHIATILTKISTYNGHLPTGSPLSPILSFYACKPMFDEIYQLALEHNCVMTLYVDDICVSGDKATKALLWKIKQIIHRYGLRYHKVKFYFQKQPKTVTGVIVTENSIKLPNRRHQAITERITYIQSPSITAKEKRQANNSLLGQLNEAMQLEPKLAKTKALLIQQGVLKPHMSLPRSNSKRKTK